MILNYMTETVSARNMDNGLLPKWAENEHLFNCEGNVRGLFREFIIDRLWRIFKYLHFNKKESSLRGLSFCVEINI